MKATLLALAAAAALLPAAAQGAIVKKSTSAICHDSASPWYERTKTFDAFPDIEACLSSGGRLPKGRTARKTAMPTSSPDYDRDRHFGDWIDVDGDCLNTRHELLAELSTGPVAPRGCLVVRGRWNDPYTGRIFTESRDVDIDHMVPLKWAWDHGADLWTRARRVAFANDPRNLFVVDAPTNRGKSADGPLDWLPPNPSFRCEYVLRFERIVRLYDLRTSPREARDLDALRDELCG